MEQNKNGLINEDDSLCFILQWHITHRCNLRCSHCYQDDYTAFETKESLEKVFDQFEALIKKYRFKGHINITGGEPLTHPELFWVLKEARRRNMSTAVLTNGTLIGRKEAWRLRANGVDYVQVSLDGTRKAHDKIRGKGSFDQAVNGIRELLAQRVFTSISFTAQRGNLGELPKLERYCRILGVDKVWFDRVIIPKDEDKDGLTLTSKEFERLSKKASKLNKRGVLTCARALQFIHCGQKYIYSCSAGERLLTVLADGSVMPCRRLPYITGNINESDLLTLYETHPEILKLRNSGIPEDCGGCEYAETCRGGSKCVACAKTGRSDVADPDCPFLKK